MMKVLFIHGLASSGAYKTASTLNTLLRPCEVISPDFPIEPDIAMSMLRGIVEEEEPDLVVGLSLGGFLAQKLHGVRKILINPDLHPSILLSSKMGEVEYLSPRKDGARSFFIDEAIVAGYKALEDGQFDALDEHEIELTDGMFADADEMVRCGDEFEAHYPGHAHSYPGTHLPTFPEIKNYLLPLVTGHGVQV